LHNLLKLLLLALNLGSVLTHNNAVRDSSLTTLALRNSYLPACSLQLYHFALCSRQLECFANTSTLS
jgi:hypothetical protein